MSESSQVTRTITILVPQASLGTPGSGWSFTVVLHGQDGFGEDGARTFTPTPGTFTFGRCETDPSPDPRCNVPLTDLPKAMDVLTPPGVDQATELDRSLGPVVLRGVPVPRPSMVIRASTRSPSSMNRSGVILISSQVPNQRSKNRPHASRPS